jgi:hypothetical protein
MYCTQHAAVYHMDIESPSYKTCTVSAVRTFTQTADVSLN